MMIMMIFAVCGTCV